MILLKIQAIDIHSNEEIFTMTTSISQEQYEDIEWISKWDRKYYADRLHKLFKAFKEIIDND